MKKILALIILILSAGVTAQAQTVTLTSTADTWLRGGSYGPYGADVTMRLYNNGFPGYIRFDLSSLGAIEILDAKFNTSITSGPSWVTGRYYVYGLNNVEGNTPQNWDEATLTWNRSGYTVAGSELVGVPYTASVANGRVTNLDQDTGASVTETNNAGRVTVTGSDLTAFLQGRVFDGGLSTIIIAAAGSKDFYYATKENSNPDLAPTLELTYAPITYAYLPTPANGVKVQLDAINELAWHIPDPNIAGQTVSCDVYFGTTEPNAALTNYGLSLVYDDITTTPVAFPGIPQPGTTYYWVVDCTDPASGTTAGKWWSFYVSGAPVLISEPQVAADFVGGFASMSTSFTSLKDLISGYPKWYKAGSPDTEVSDSDPDVNITLQFDSVSGIYTSTLTITNLEVTDEAEYYCVIENQDEAITTASAALIVKRLLAKYDFEGNCDDSSGQSMNATATDINYLAGVSLLGNAADFNGTSSYAKMATGFKNFDAGMTISVWANPATTTNWARFIDLGNSTDAGDNNILFTRSASSADLLVQTWEGSTSSSFYATGAITNGQWQLLTASIDQDGNITVYRNGFVFASGTIKLPTSVERTSNFIGDSNWTADSLYQGQMDDLRIYNYGISADEAATIYAQGVGDFCRVRPAYDFTGDCKVNIADLAYLADYWLNCGLYPACD